jgi:hypothetical protein
MVNMEYSSYRLRRQILADVEHRPVANDFLLIVEYIDWNTGVKKFTSKAHYTNWLKMLAEANGYTEDGPWYLGQVVKWLVDAGYATLDTKTGTLTLMQQSDWGDEEPDGQTA